MKKMILNISILTAVAGCMEVASQPVSSAPPSILMIAKNAATDRLKDPESARFKSEYQAYRLENGDWGICGSMNAKNSFGGYVGYEPYYVRIRGSEIKKIELEGRYATIHCDKLQAGKVLLAD